MDRNNTIDWLPPVSETDTGERRRVGVELEFAGLEPVDIVRAITASFGGESVPHSKLDWRVENTRLGNFKVELDWEYLKTLAVKQESLDLGEFNELSNFVVDFITRAVEQLVPWEVVTPPVPMQNLQDLSELVIKLRELGALGTRNSPQYAFGMHLNPELPDLRGETILNYLRAFLCLYDWIVQEEQTDLTRRVTSYIKHFDFYYIAKVIDPDYRPSLPALIDDYLEYNPTRNRSLDLLPLFAHIDESRVREAVEDPRIKARPTLHYRLPNCDIDNPRWNLDSTWRLWLEVEKLAGDSLRLESMCREYQRELQRVTYLFDSRWAERTGLLLAENASPKDA